MKKLQTLAILGIGFGIALGSASASTITYFSNANFTSVNGLACDPTAGCTITGFMGETVTVVNASATAPDGASDTASIRVTNNASGKSALLTFENFSDPQTVSLSTTPNNINFDYFHSYGDGSGDTFVFPTFNLSLVTTDVNETGTPVNQSITFLGIGNQGTISGDGNVSSTGATATITAGSSTVTVTWQSPLTMVVPTTAGTTFTINSTTPIVAPSSLVGESTVQATVYSGVPEPGSIFLMASGLLGAGILSRRRLFGTK